MRIAVIGLDDGALADALALGRCHEVTIAGPDVPRVEAINRGEYPLADPVLAGYVGEYAPRVRASCSPADALRGAEMVLICSDGAEIGPDALADLVAAHTAEALTLCPRAPVVVRAPVAIGWTETLRRELGTQRLVCAPPLRREGRSLGDTLEPRAIVVGDRGSLGARVAACLAGAAIGGAEVPVRRIGPTEAEAVGHFAQVFLAARVTYFNELDSYAMAEGLDAGQIIDGVSLDPRIGGHGTNPCFGFGGRSLPQSAAHLERAFAGLQARVVPMISAARDARIGFLAAQVLARRPRCVGIYRGRSAGIAEDPVALLAERLTAAGVETRHHQAGTRGLAGFKDGCDLIVAQRMTPELRDVAGRVFCRDLGAAPGRLVADTAAASALMVPLGRAGMQQHGSASAR